MIHAIINTRSSKFPTIEYGALIVAFTAWGVLCLEAMNRRSVLVACLEYLKQDLRGANSETDRRGRFLCINWIALDYLKNPGQLPLAEALHMGRGQHPLRAYIIPTNITHNLNIVGMAEHG